MRASFERVVKGGGFYHFTDESNVGSIVACKGLLSWRELKRRGIAVPQPGGNLMSRQLDDALGMDEYVHLCFRRSHPMQYAAQEQGRLPNPVWLKIASDVLEIADIRFTAAVSNSPGTPTLEFGQVCEKLDLDVIYNRLDWKDPAIQSRLKLAEKYELLVPNHVPISLISKA